LTGRTLLNHKSALVEMSGSGNTIKAMRVLEVMDLQTRVLVDLDFALKQGITEGYLEVDDVDVQSCKARLQMIFQQHNMLLGVDELPQKNQHLSAAEAFSILSQEVPILPT
jgi:putative ATP-dependent endonuclease of OLD family